MWTGNFKDVITDAKFCGGEKADCCPLRYDNVYPDRALPTFWRNLLLPFAGHKKRGRANIFYQEGGNHQQHCMVS
jgi:hypothetical protein